MPIPLSFHNIQYERYAVPSSSRNAPPENTLITIAGPDGIGMVAPVDQVDAGHVSPAESNLPTIIQVHQVIPATREECAVRVSRDANILGNHEMVPGAVIIRQEPLPEQPCMFYEIRVFIFINRAIVALISG